MNSVATKTTIITTEVEKNYKKNVATQKLMLRHNKELKVDIFIVTINVVEQETFIATKENYVMTENGREM